MRMRSLSSLRLLFRYSPSKLAPSPNHFAGDHLTVEREPCFKVVASHMVTVTLGTVAQTRHLSPGLKRMTSKTRARGRKGTGLSICLVFGCCGRMKNRSNKAF